MQGHERQGIEQQMKDVPGQQQSGQQGVEEGVDIGLSVIACIVG